MSYTYLCENSICSPGQEAESLAECCSDTPQFALWKLNHTADASCSKDSATESCHDSQFGTTLPHSTPPLGADELTSCVEGFPAKTFPPPEKAQESKAREADCGGTWPEWFAKFDPVTFSWKTRQCSLLAGLDVFSGTWPRWGMMRGGVCWELTTPGHRIVENESGFGENWPTPDARDAQPEGLAAGVRRMEKYSTCGLQTAVALWPTPRSCSAMAATITPETAHAANRFPNLETVVGRRIWPTPTKSDGMGGPGTSENRMGGENLRTAVKMWPTPQASDNRDRGNLGMPAILRRQEKGKQIGLGQSVSDTSGALNPDWVEWLMGWPIGWTDLRPLAMDRCHSVLLSHGAHSQDSNP
jgi:hypothetical protein